MDVSQPLWEVILQPVWSKYPDGGFTATQWRDELKTELRQPRQELRVWLLPLLHLVSFSLEI